LIRLRRALREAGALLLAATALGFVYSAAMQKGIFGPSLAPAEGRSTSSLLAPVMIPLDSAKAYFAAGQALFVDARHEFDYRLGHIKGAVNVPLSEYDAKKYTLNAIPRGKPIVVYCDGAECNSSIEFSAKLFADGFADVKIFFGGWREWEAAHLPIEGSGR
jgi:rhodanese-related sulfurtransferase